MELSTSHQEKLNWQFQASYAEDGKKKEVVSYFDGTLRNRQTVTKINSEANEHIVIGEVIYDNQGRPAVEILPVPHTGLTNHQIDYYPNFNLNSNQDPYSHYDFDWNVGDNCNTTTDAMDASNGAARYYSPSNPERDDYQAYVPNANGFPFSQIQYTPDNTGRIAKKSGVGPTHQLGQGHEMQYFYTTPSQEELERLFGDVVGDALHYKKNIVVDPNGQLSVSYIDPQGRTIATALLAIHLKI